MNRNLYSILALVFAFSLYGQPGSGMGKNYDASKEVTVSGTVTEITRVPHGDMREGIHLSMSAGNETLVVMLGPTFYLEKQSVKVLKGDSITVIGSRTGNAIIARQVTKGSQTLKLRTETGAPVWGRGGR